MRRKITERIGEEERGIKDRNRGEQRGKAQCEGTEYGNLSHTNVNEQRLWAHESPSDLSTLQMT